MNNPLQYFDNHGTADKLYFTSDGLAFFDEQNAINHSGSLDDTTVTAMTREEVYAELPDVDSEYDRLDEPDAE